MDIHEKARNNLRVRGDARNANKGDSFKRLVRLISRANKLLLFSPVIERRPCTWRWICERIAKPTRRQRSHPSWKFLDQSLKIQAQSSSKRGAFP